MFTADITDCGKNETCQCVKYRFQCTRDDKACDEYEQSNNITKWGYVTMAASACEEIKSAPFFYQELTCCSEDRCNQPDSGICTWSQARRRRALSKFTDLFNV